MPDYFKVQPDYTRLMNKHYTPGRGGRKIKYIVRHHNAGVSNTDQTWNTWQSRQASAHYQVEVSGRIGQLVYDGDTAWANGNSVANAESITIEHSNSAGAGQDWPINNSTIEAGAKWAAALCWYYKLGRPEYGKNIRDHRNFYSTSCPYHLANGGKYHDKYMKIAQAHYDWMVKTAANPAPVINEINSEAQRARAWIGKRITDGEIRTPDGKGRFAQFENGYVYFHPDVRSDRVAGSRAFAVPTDVFETWAGLGWEAGPLGYPVERHVTLDEGTVQAFQGGVIYRKFGQPGFYVHGAIGDRYRELGYENGPWGWPTSNETPSPDGGRQQKFEHKTALWHPKGVNAI